MSIEKIQEIHDKAFNEAYNVFVNWISYKLNRLEEIFPRHKFEFFDAMGSTSIDIEPSVFGQTGYIIDYVDFPPDVQNKPAVKELANRLEEIFQYYIEFDEYFHGQTGRIGSKGILE